MATKKRSAVQSPQEQSSPSHGEPVVTPESPPSQIAVDLWQRLSKDARSVFADYSGTQKLAVCEAVSPVWKKLSPRQRDAVEGHLHTLATQAAREVGREVVPEPVPLTALVEKVRYEVNAVHTLLPSVDALRKMGAELQAPADSDFWGLLDIVVGITGALQEIDTACSEATHGQ